jgi:Skp family chaperone for outer membrane proteins
MAGVSPVGAGLAAALSAYQFGEGVSQTRKGKKLLNTARPTYQTPQAEEDAYKAARFNYGTAASNIQEAGKNQLDANYGQQVGAIDQAATDSSGLLAALTAAGTARNRANIQLTNEAIGQKQNDLNSLLGASHVYSQYKDKEWDWNKKQPYSDTMLAASSLIKAGKENKFGALNNVANVGISLLGGAGTPTDTTVDPNAAIPDPNLIPTNDPTAAAAMTYNPITTNGSQPQLSPQQLFNLIYGKK